MRGRVEKTTLSKSGKALRVQIGNTWVGAALDSKLDAAVGQSIEATIEDGDYGPWVKGWGYDPAAGPTAPQKPANGSPGVSGDRFYMPFVSNVVAHAIQAGVITTPQQISAWAKAAYDAAQAIDAL